jgi:hypothetical protein
MRFISQLGIPGVGFHPEAARTGRGLGLVSMEERLKLLNGTLAIESQPKRGTTIHARVPLLQVGILHWRQDKNSGVLRQVAKDFHWEQTAECSAQIFSNI